MAPAEAHRSSSPLISMAPVIPPRLRRSNLAPVVSVELLPTQLKPTLPSPAPPGVIPRRVGLFNSANNFYPTFTSTIDRATPKPGGISIASQSGAYGSHIYMVAHQRGLGIRYWMTTGNEVDLSVGETIQLMAEDPDVHTIMAYAESVKDGDQFTKALDTARSEKKPVIFIHLL